MFWKRRSKSFNNREYWIAGLSVTTGAGLAGFTYFCDPDPGMRAARGFPTGLPAGSHKANVWSGTEATASCTGLRGYSPRHGHCFMGKKMYPMRCSWSACVAAWAMSCSIRSPFPPGWRKASYSSPVWLRAPIRSVFSGQFREVPGVMKMEELLTYEKRKNGRPIPKLLGGLAGAAVLLAVASSRAHSASRRAA